MKKLLKSQTLNKETCPAILKKQQQQQLTNSLEKGKINFVKYEKYFTYSFGQKVVTRDLPGSPVVKNLPCNAGDTGLIPG